MSGKILPTLALTSGEPAGIGPDLCLALAARLAGGTSALAAPCRLVVLADRDMLAARARTLGLAVSLAEYRRDAGAAQASAGSPPRLEVLHVPLLRPSQPGRLDPGNAPYVLALIDRALAGCIEGEFAALVTAPVHKGVINDAGIAFTGHTEYLAWRTGTPRVVMMLAGAGLRVALATTHLPLKDVPGAIDREGLEQTLTILHDELRARLSIARPRILVAGLNPHAGEGGHMGREEIEVIAPVVDKLCAAGMDLAGPLPADTLFTRRVLAGSDAQLAMYHDQGLAVLKYAAFEEGVNITLGLPIIRTSVDHGTALDLAGTGTADVGSLLAAVDAAAAMAAAAPR